MSSTTYRYLQNFVYILLPLLLIFNSITLMSSINSASNFINYYINQTLLEEHISFKKYQIIQNIYAESSSSSSSSETEITSSAATANQNETNTSAIQHPDNRITILSFLLSFGIVFGIFIFVNYILKSSEMKFGDILRDESGFPSLARFQFLSWTFIVMFAVLSVFLIRLFMETPQFPNDIPGNLLILTGISIAVPFVSNPISGIKYGEKKPPRGTLKNEDRRRLATMLMENEKPTISRFQMFAWTIISIIIYLGIFFSQTTFLLNNVNILTVPDIPQIFVYLMGLSQVGYVGSKATISKSLAVTQIVPKKAHANEDVIILGTNFGSENEKGRVLFEDGAKDIVGNQVTVRQQDIIEWKENRIHIKVPDRVLVPNTDYYIRVENRGIISYKGGGQDDEARFTML
jgi:hypothetical protein